MVKHPSDISLEDFVKREISIWGEEYIDRLIDGGYTPIQLPSGKWSWLYDRAAVTST